MAVVLPYPDMDFVPLDILTAAEQDQLVANIEYLAGIFPLGSSDIADGAITSDKIDWTTMQGEQYIGRFTTAPSFTLPAGYRIYHIRGKATYSSASANAGMFIARTNRTGTDWVRRIIGSSTGLDWGEFSYTDGHLVTLGSAVGLGTSSGSVTIDLTIIATGNEWQTMGTFTHTGAQNSGVVFSDTTTSNIANNTTITFSSTGRTFSAIDIIVTGILA